MSFAEAVEKLFLRLVLSVVIPAGIIVLCLYIFNSLADVKYLPASGLAFGVGFFVIYLVFKYLIRPDTAQNDRQRLKRYFIIFTIGLVLNTEIVYLLVTYAGVPLLTAQTIAAVVIAYESYYAYLSLLYREAGVKVVIRAPRRLEDEIIYYDETGIEIF